MNDLQDEVVAVEGALVNGPLTLASVHVSGASTFAGPAVFSTTVTLGRNAAHLTHSANQAVASGAFTGLNWDTETYDPSGLHSTASNSSRITFAQSTGLWHVGAQVEWNTASTVGVRSCRLVLNDATNLAGQTSPGSGAADAHCISMLVRVTATTDYATVQVFQNSGSTNSIGVGGNYGQAFWAYKVSA